MILKKKDSESYTGDDEAIHRAETATSEDAAAATSEDTP